MGSGRPIFLIGPKDCDAARIVSDSNTGMVHSYSDKAKMKESITRYYHDYKQSEDTSSFNNIEPYSRKELTKKLAILLDKVTEENKH